MPKKVKKIPEEFKTYEEAAEFWDTHNSADYLDEFEDVEIKVDIQKRHYLIELDSRTAELLQELARKKGVSVNYLANELLQGQLAEAE
ncbi:MAG: CopG family antitoxin [Candidatus Methanoperedens sp.]|nr:CopG family antitoxin [Candidatus Methanoperedens sp.]MCZ7371575.1 CopG family antitoxin [Candidatus Methanoperedens sp.]